MGLFTLSFILLIQMLFTQADNIAGAISLGLLFKFVMLLMPSLLVLTIPMSIVTGVLLGIGRMTVDSEIKAFRTHGVNLFRVFAPVLILGVLASAFCLANSLYFAPKLLNHSMRLIKQLKYELINNLEPGRFEDRLSSKGAEIVLYFADKDPENGELKDVYLLIEGEPDELDSAVDNRQKTLFLASRGRLETPLEFLDDKDEEKTEEEEEQAVDKLIHLELFNGTIHFMQGRDDPRYGIIRFDELSQDFFMEQEENSRRKTMPAFTLDQINRRINKQRKEDRKDGVPRFEEDGTPLFNKDVQYLIAEKYQRISISLACICFVLMGVPLAIYVKPSGTSIGVGVAFGLIMVFYGLMHYGVVLTRQTRGWQPEFGPFIIILPNIILTILGALLLYRTVRR